MVTIEKEHPNIFPQIFDKWGVKTIYRKIDVYGEAYFNPKILKNVIKLALPVRVWVEKTVNVIKHTDSPVKKKFWAQQSVKKVVLTFFRDMKWPISIYFLEKAFTVNSVSYCKLTSPGGSTLQSSSCTATYHPSRKLSMLDKPDMQDTAGEVGTSSYVMYSSGPIHMDEQRLDDQLEPT